MLRIFIKYILKTKVNEDCLTSKIAFLLNEPLNNIIESHRLNERREKKKRSYRGRDEDDDDEIHNVVQSWGLYVRKKATLLDYLNDKKCDVGKKMDIIDEATKIIFAAIGG